MVYVVMVFCVQMAAIVTQIRSGEQQNKQNKYEYDSDEDIEGGTWEHKLRSAEMEATKGTYYYWCSHSMLMTHMLQHWQRS